MNRTGCPTIMEFISIQSLKAFASILHRDMSPTFLAVDNNKLFFTVLAVLINLSCFRIMFSSVSMSFFSPICSIHIIYLYRAFPPLIVTYFQSAIFTFTFNYIYCPSVARGFLKQIFHVSNRLNSL